MSRFSFAPQSDTIDKTHYQCAHCGSWLTANGKAPDAKHNTVKKVYCNSCDTAPKRAAVDAENAMIRKGGTKK